MKRTNLVLRIGLFSLIVIVGTLAAMIAGETAGLALADLSNASVGVMTQTAYGDALYAALSGNTKPRGIYRSEDKGRSWQMVSIGPEASLNALAVHPVNEQILYAGTIGGAALSGGSLWYSDDGGRTWDQSRLRLPTNAERKLPAVSVLTVDPNHPGLLYVGTAGQGLYRFQVKEEAYELVGDPALHNLYVKDIIVSPDGPVYALTTNGLIVVSGDVWSKIESLPNLAVSLAVDPANPQTLYAGTAAYGAYRSTDGGQTWEPINTGLGWQPGVLLRVSAVTVDETNSQHLALTTAYEVGKQVVGGGVYESVDAGRSWIKLADSPAIVERLTIKDGGVYAATAGGLVRYGEPLPPASSLAWLQPESLANPTGIQVLILILTIALAGWALIGRLTWIPGQRRAV